MWRAGFDIDQKYSFIIYVYGMLSANMQSGELFIFELPNFYHISEKHTQMEYGIPSSQVEPPNANPNQNKLCLREVNIRYIMPTVL